MKVSAVIVTPSAGRPVIPREGVERRRLFYFNVDKTKLIVIPREGVERRRGKLRKLWKRHQKSDPERGS